MLKTLLATAKAFASSIGLRPIWSTKNTQNKPATLGKEAEEILNGNFTIIEEELAKKADETKVVDGKTVSVVRAENGTIDLSSYAETTTRAGTVVRTEDGTIPEVDISGKADKTGYYHVSQITGNYAYTDKQTARNAVPAGLRKKGQVILFQLASGDWIAEQFIGAAISEWGNLYFWESFGSSSRVFDGGRADTRYGGARIIDCGTA